MVRAAVTTDSVTHYALDVTGGRVTVARLVRLACERHLRDLEIAAERGLYFDSEAAEWSIGFFAQLSHSKGEWAGQPLVLEPWQSFVVGNLFGWKRADGTRRFRTSYVSVGRKNGKSTLAAGLGLLLAFFDGEAGAEVYAAATKRDQAKIVWGEARAMVLASPPLRQRISVLTGNLHSERTRSKFEPLGADADSTDGLNVHAAVIDELHAHKTRAMWDVIETATAARRQPLTFAITTAGFDRNSVCYEQDDYAAKVLEGVIEDDSFFAYVARIDEGDDWTDRGCWPKANPNLGVSVKLDDLERKCDKAKLVPGEQNAFLRLHLNVWTQQETRWLSPEVWEGGSIGPPEDLEGRRCYAGLDLSSTTDVTALVLWFPDDDGGGDALSCFWVPEEALQVRSRRDRVPYDLWQRQGFIDATGGNVVDYDRVRERIKELGTIYEIREVAVDRWNSTQLQTQLQGDGFTVVPFGQGFASMTAPTKELERLLLERSLRHGGNPVLRWMASNVAVDQDAAGNLKPSKSRSTERIDGIVALVMALGRAMVEPKEPESPGFFWVAGGARGDWDW
jgi:phage terminase large subunit-like protein